MKTKTKRLAVVMVVLATAACAKMKSMGGDPGIADGDPEAVQASATPGEGDEEISRTSTPAPTRTAVAVAATPRATYRAMPNGTPASVSTVVPEPAPDYSGLNVVNGKPYADMFFKHFGVNPTIDTDEEDTSTFAIDVDTASYAVSRSYLQRGNLPEEDAVRVEEFVNAFDYDYANPDEDAFSVQVEGFPSPNRSGYHVLHIGLKGKEVSKASRKNANLVFVIDVSGSMATENRLELVKRALGMLVDELDERDTVGLVVYGSDARKVLDPTPATEKEEIIAAIQSLHSEGSTNVQAGLKVGYKMASKNFLKGGINRIVLCSDGVANNGITNADKIFATVEEEAKDGITISAVGFGMGNYNDVLMERLADIGDGNYAYVDRLEEAKKIFVEQLTGTLQVIAKDVKIQVEFDKNKVSRYRLLGFENRRLENHQFDDDKVDAGEIGAGHTVTAMYEVKLTEPAKGEGSFATLRIRHKQPEGGASTKIEKKVPYAVVRDDYAKTSGPTRLSFVAAGFAEKLRGSYWVRNLEWDHLVGLWEDIPGPVRNRAEVQELGSLIRKARLLDKRGDKFEKEYGPVAGMDFDNIPVLQ